MKGKWAASDQFSDPPPLDNFPEGANLPGVGEDNLFRVGLGLGFGGDGGLGLAG